MDNEQDPWTETEKEPIIREQEGKKQEEKHILPILSLILSILVSPAGLVLSIIALHLLKEEKEKKLAKIGLIISIVMLSLYAGAIIIIFVVFKKYSISFL